MTKRTYLKCIKCGGSGDQRMGICGKCAFPKKKPAVKKTAKKVRK